MMSTNNSTRALAVHDILKDIYPDTRPPLVYHNHFQLLIAVILSAQTTDLNVNKATPRLFARYPDAAALANAPLAELEELVYVTGFFRSKARNIKKAAGALAENFAGKVPDSMEALLTLPGVGRKTANVILGTLFARPAIIVDTHFARVCRRLELTEASAPEKIEQALVNLLPEHVRTAFSMEINKHGRTRCMARKPDCGSCEIAALCPSAAE